ncbi:SGF11 [Candida theae]|uniref:SGF11 n=1 Tax=Candida theae TaxID=1198502 RepID=A0AAD5BAL7_9ASCO|nr:SGF11 [Candida theae]KAI5948981.1 SGF11 [Candida theae]
MTEAQVTYHTLTESLLKDMISIIIKQQIANTYSDYMTVENNTVADPQVDQLLANFNQPKDVSRDIFGQDKTKLKTNETSRYFSCENCGQKEKDLSGENMVEFHYKTNFGMSFEIAMYNINPLKDPIGWYMFQDQLWTSATYLQQTFFTTATNKINLQHTKNTWI